MYSIKVDWSEALGNGNWDNIGRNMLEQKCKHKKGVAYSGYCEKCDISEDSASPMMNYAYPLETTPDDDKVLQVVEETNCTVMYNNDTDEYFIVLCGGGMDLSQDIALAYVILERWIPESLIVEVCNQKNFSVSGKNFEILQKAIIEQAENYQGRFKDLADKWKNL